MFPAVSQPVSQVASVDGAARPRLLVLTTDFPPPHGGIQVLVARLAESMTGFATVLVAPNAPGANAFDAACHVDVRRAPAPAHARARAIALNAAALAVAARVRPQVTLSAHVVTSPAAQVIRSVLGAPTVQYFYANEVVGKPRLAAFAARAANVCIAISAYTASLVQATGAHPTEMLLIPPGVDIPADRTPLPCERPTMLTVARLNNSYKGHDVLIAALSQIRAEVPDVQWIVIGDGPLRGELEARARARGVAETIRFLGWVSDEERNAWLRRAHVFVMPSRLPGGGLAGEGFGIVFMEASSFGKPVVAGNVGGALDAVADGETGLLVDPMNPAAVASAVSELLLDRERAQRLGRAGAQRAREFAWPVIASRVQAALLGASGVGARASGTAA
jgi:phosphatidyl-myo-inositol dimannoside synthase